MARPWWSSLPESGFDERIRALIVRHTDVTRPLRESDRLLEDLGLDGDDAVDFFEAYGTTFGVDLDPLHQRWAQHFGPEGFPLSFTLGMVLIAAVAGGLLAFTGLPKWAVIGLGLAAAFGWLIGLRAWPLGRGQVAIPITVGDLNEAARLGRWPDPDRPG